MFLYDEICMLAHKKNQVHALEMGNWEWCEGGKGPEELPPSCGWSCLVENIKLFSKQRGDQWMSTVVPFYNPLACHLNFHIFCLWQGKELSISHLLMIFLVKVK